jgi:hypothetical protein
MLKSVRQLHARTSALTNVNGVALVLAWRVPRRYMAVAHGGRVARERLPGSLLPATCSAFALPLAATRVDLGSRI